MAVAGHKLHWIIIYSADWTTGMNDWTHEKKKRMNRIIVQKHSDYSLASTIHIRRAKVCRSSRNSSLLSHPSSLSCESAMADVAWIQTDYKPPPSFSMGKNAHDV